MAATVDVEARPGAKATARFVRMSASKVRVVLNLIRNKPVAEAIEILTFSERLAAKEVLKCLQSAVANAEHNEDIPEAELFVSVCFADEGPSLRRFRPRARGRAGRISKQTCHITVEVSRLSDSELDEMRNRDELKSATKAKSKGSKSGGADRARRVAKSKAAAAADETPAGEAEATEEVETESTETEPEAAEAVTEPEVANATSSDEEAEASDGASDEEAEASDGASDEEAEASDGASEGEEE